MGCGDLNLKKSWNPHIIKNRVGVPQREYDREAEKKKLDELRRAIEAEREAEEFAKLSGRKGEEQVGWVYATPIPPSQPPWNGGVNYSGINLDAYLLGKKGGDETARVDTSRHDADSQDAHAVIAPSAADPAMPAMKNGRNGLAEGPSHEDSRSRRHRGTSYDEWSRPRCRSRSRSGSPNHRRSPLGYRHSSTRRSQSPARQDRGNRFQDDSAQISESSRAFSYRPSLSPKRRSWEQGGRNARGTRLAQSKDSSTTLHSLTQVPHRRVHGSSSHGDV